MGNSVNRLVNFGDHHDGRRGGDHLHPGQERQRRNSEQRTAELDDDNVQQFSKVYFTAVMNQKYEGGGFKFCPNASPSDGYLDVIVVDGSSKPKVLCCLPTAFFGKHTIFHGIHIFRCKKIDIHSDLALPVHKDGESAGILKDFSVSIGSRQVRMIS